jgi:hypothetical protein
LLDVQGLQHGACECYERIKAQSQHLVGL